MSEMDSLTNEFRKAIFYVIIIIKNETWKEDK